VTGASDTRRRRFSTLVSIYSALGFVSPAVAQMPDVPQATYSDGCMSKATGDTRGEALSVERSKGGYKLTYQSFMGSPQRPVSVSGQIVGDKITFDVTMGDLPLRFSGTITPDEIRGRYHNEREVRYDSSELRWERVRPHTLRPYCQ
jgi:hypothetical protein